jgi:hypothetical protein
VKAVVSQVPEIGLWRAMRLADEGVREDFLVKALADRLEFVRTGEPRMLAITAPEGEESVLGARGFDWHRDNEERHPTLARPTRWIA